MRNRRPSNPDVSTWYRDPKDNGVRYMGIDEYGTMIEYFFLPDIPYDFNSVGTVTVYNYDAGVTSYLGVAMDETKGIALMKADLERRNQLDK